LKTWLRLDALCQEQQHTQRKFPQQTYGTQFKEMQGFQDVLYPFLPKPIVN